MRIPMASVIWRTTAIACFCAGVLSAQPAASQEVRLNEVLRSLFYTPQYVAVRTDAFTRAGIKVIGPKTTWGMQAAVTEVVSGNSNIALIGPEAAGLTQEASPDRRLVNFALLTNGDGGFILSKSPMPHFLLTDLRGKTIVTSGKGSTPALVLVDLIKKAGLDPNKDVTVRNIPVSSNIIPSYLEPSTDFAQAFEPMITQAVTEKKGHRVASVGALAGPMPYTAFMAPASYIEQHPDIIQAFTNAIYRAEIWTETHSPQEIAQLIAPDFKEVPVPLIEAVITEYKKVKIWALDPLLRPEGMDEMMRLMVDGGILKQRFPYTRSSRRNLRKARVFAALRGAQGSFCRRITCSNGAPCSRTPSLALKSGAWGPRRRAAARMNSWKPTAWAGSSTPIRTSSPAACVSAWRSCARSPLIRTSSCLMSPSRLSTIRPSSSSSVTSTQSSGATAKRRCSSPTILRRRCRCATE